MAKERSGTGFAIVNPSPDVQKVLVIAGLDKLVKG
jgi:anti-anti-sigma regulatory factor